MWSGVSAFRVTWLSLTRFTCVHASQVPWRMTRDTKNFLRALENRTTVYIFRPFLGLKPFSRVNYTNPLAHKKDAYAVSPTKLYPTVPAHSTKSYAQLSHFFLYTVPQKDLHKSTNTQAVCKMIMKSTPSSFRTKFSDCFLACSAHITCGTRDLFRW